MLRTLAITLSFAALATAASAQPANLSDTQMDYVTAGAILPGVIVTNAAATAVPPSVSLPQPVNGQLPLPSQAGSIDVNATTPPATVHHFF